MGGRIHEMILARQPVKIFDASQIFDWILPADKTPGSLT